jgi:hypothetical protein
MNFVNEEKILGHLYYDVCIHEVFEKPDVTPDPVLYYGSTYVMAMINNWCHQLLKNKMDKTKRTYKIVKVQQWVDGNLRDEKSWDHIKVNEECGIAPIDSDEKNIQTSNLREAPVYRFVGENFIYYNVELQIVGGKHKKVNPTDLVALLMDRTVGFHDTDHLGKTPNKSFFYLKHNETKLPVSYKIIKSEECARISKVMDDEYDDKLEDDPEQPQERLMTV